MSAHAHAPTSRAPPDEVRSLDLLAQRLQHLNGALEVLKNTQLSYSWDASAPPAPWPTVAHQSNIINGRLSALLEAFAANRTLLNQAHPFPLPTFPGRSHENMATQLTRKKMVPWVEDWIADGLKLATGDEAAEDAVARVDGARPLKLAGEGGLTGEQIEELWDWAGPAGGEIGREVLTAEDEDEEGDDEDEDEEDEEEGAMEGVEGAGAEKKTETMPPIRPMMPLDDILKFVSTGVAP
ncbi:putative rna polymerase ii mediator complex component med8 protein [Lasiodiplodia theobromae]|uniref:Mediator of RNA polymerase II transcription subunit 8 n=1 Tax=Lasiodiplodia theobromae TaxID=45133 RepID=A0A5N5DPK1_9PEZI|nr:Mediator of RNA polymerase II transcription subunit 8 [Lasiodiplodia theobromae]KAF9634653.1 putative rna polymerase ii mediator complex component med8 protein [Lasiodiplodia theobromae]